MHFIFINYTHTHTHTHSHTYPYRHRDLIVFLLEFKKFAFSFLFFLHSQGLDESSEIPRKTIYISKGTERGIPVPSRKLTSNSKSQFFNVKSPIFNIFRVFPPPQISKQLTQFKQITVLGNNTYHHLYSHASPSEEHKSAFKLLGPPNEGQNKGGRTGF